MKRVRIWFVLLCTGLLCCGCQETPDEVKERMKSYGDNKQLASEEVKYCTVDELRKSNISDLGIELDNMILPDEVDFSGIDAVEELSMSFDRDHLKNKKQFLKIFGINEDTLIEEGKTATGKTVTYDSSKEKKYFAIEDNGWMAYASGATYDLINSELPQSVKRRYDLYRDDISEERVQLGEDSVKLAEICGDAEAWLENNLTVSNYKYKVSDLYVRELKNGASEYNQISLFAEIIYKGMPLNAYGMQIKSEGADGKVDLMTYGIDMNYEGKGEMTYFSNITGGLEVHSSKTVDRVIDLASAVRIVNEEISGFNELTISKIIPLYALSPQYKPEDKEAFSAVGQVVEGRPVYAFIINEGEDDSELGIHKSNACKFIFVDMITGKITTNIR